MAFGPGRLGIFSLDNAAGTPVDISAYITKIDADYPIGMGDTTTLGAASESQIPVIKQIVKISLEALNDPTLGAMMTTIRNNGGGLTSANGSLSFVYGPMGSTTGNPKSTGECFLAGYKKSTDVKNVNGFTISIETTGDVTEGAY